MSCFCRVTARRDNVGVVIVRERGTPNVYRLAPGESCVIPSHRLSVIAGPTDRVDITEEVRRECHQYRA